jgi:hypothetical protein
MPQREPCAAAALYRHLPSAERDAVQQRPSGSVADAIYAHLKRPLPPVNRWREAAANARAAWAEANARAWGRR